jgi:hypothetical protein
MRFPTFLEWIKVLCVLRNLRKGDLPERERTKTEEVRE